MVLENNLGRPLKRMLLVGNLEMLVRLSAERKDAIDAL